MAATQPSSPPSRYSSHFERTTAAPSGNDDIYDRFSNELSQSRHHDETEPLLSHRNNNNNNDGSNGDRLISVSAYNGRAKWWSDRQPSPWWIIPGLFIVSINYGILIAPLQQFYVTCICEEYFSAHVILPGQNSSSINSDIPYEQCLIPEVSSLVSKFYTIYDLCGFASALAVMAFWGKISDQKGRKIILICNHFGPLVGDLVLIAVALFRKTIGYKWLFVGSIITGLLGDRQLGTAASSAYISDCTSPDKRSVVFGRISALSYLGLVIGPILGGYIIRVTGNFIYLLYISLIIHSLWWLFLLIVVPESLKNKQPKLNDGKKSKRFLDNFNFIAAISILFTAHNPHASKFSLPALGTTHFLLDLTLGATAVKLIYLGLKFKWTAYENGIWLSYTSMLRILVLLVLIPVLTWFFKKNAILRQSEIPRRNANSDVYSIPNNDAQRTIHSDIVFNTWMVRVGYLLDLVAYITFGAATVGWMFYVGTSFHSLSSISGPSIRSLLTMMAPPQQIGEVLVAVAILDSVAGIISRVAINLVFAATAVTMPNLIFFLLSGLIFLAVCLTFLIKPSRSER